MSGTSAGTTGETSAPSSSVSEFFSHEVRTSVVGGAARVLTDTVRVRSFEELTAHLEQLAGLLGIDTSDLNDPGNVPPLPSEFLALLPPDIAALLSDPAFPPPEPCESPPAPAP